MPITSLSPAQGFQAFTDSTTNVMVATATVGTPAAGTFYSSIVGRSSMSDISKDLKPRMGIERIMTQQIYALQNEFGPNGEAVYAIPNDPFNQIRFVGSWSNNNAGSGQYIANTSTSVDYVEITFYGTGLNVLMYQDTGNRPLVASVDGAAAGANFVPTAPNAILSGRNVAQNTLLNAVTGLALGIHTVKISGNGTNTPVAIEGFEVLNDSSSVKVNAGQGYVAGSKLTLASQSAFSYSAPVTGTRGGRVLVYQASDGTIGQVFQAVNASQLNLTSADHTNEEIVRTYHFREFGANFSADFSTFFNANTYNAAFTLDDGTTTLAGNSIGLASGTPGVSINLAATSFATFTFIGTGLDVLMYAQNGSAGTSPTFNISVDGTTVNGGGAQYTLNSLPTQFKVVSGLPYGTHTVRFLKTTGNGTVDLAINKWIVYQPKKPSLPAGSIELADYNVMANFSTNTQGFLTTSNGMMRKVVTREMVYVGTWSALSTGTSDISGWQISTGTQNDYIQYSFFGTGFDFRCFGQTAAATCVITIDGATNFTVSNSSPTAGVGWSGALTTSFYGTDISSFTASSGTFVTTNALAGGSGVVVQGLSMGLHTVKIQKTDAGAGRLYPSAFDIITPIHSFKSNLYADLQSTLLVGSNSISDNRVSTPVKDSLIVPKAWSKAIGLAATSTTSTALVPLPDMSLVINVTTGNAIDISFWCTFTTNNNNVGDLITYVDGQQIDTLVQLGLGGDTRFEVATNTRVPVSKGVHKIEVFWSTGSGTLTAFQNRRILLVKEA